MEVCGIYVFQCRLNRLQFVYEKSTGRSLTIPPTLHQSITDRLLNLRSITIFSDDIEWTEFVYLLKGCNYGSLVESNSSWKSLTIHKVESFQYTSDRFPIAFVFTIESNTNSPANMMIGNIINSFISKVEALSLEKTIFSLHEILKSINNKVDSHDIIQEFSNHCNSEDVDIEQVISHLCHAFSIITNSNVFIAINDSSQKIDLYYSHIDHMDQLSHRKLIDRQYIKFLDEQLDGETQFSLLNVNQWSMEALGFSSLDEFEHIGATLPIMNINAVLIIEVLRSKDLNILALKETIVQASVITNQALQNISIREQYYLTNSLNGWVSSLELKPSIEITFEVLNQNLFNSYASILEQLGMDSFCLLCNGTLIKHIHHSSNILPDSMFKLHANSFIELKSLRGTNEKQLWIEYLQSGHIVSTVNNSNINAKIRDNLKSSKDVMFMSDQEIIDFKLIANVNASSIFLYPINTRNGIIVLVFASSKRYSSLDIYKSNINVQVFLSDSFNTLISSQFNSMIDHWKQSSILKKFQNSINVIEGILVTRNSWNTKSSFFKIWKVMTKLKQSHRKDKETEVSNQLDMKTYQEMCTHVMNAMMAILSKFKSASSANDNMNSFYLDCSQVMMQVSQLLSRCDSGKLRISLDGKEHTCETNVAIDMLNVFDAEVGSLMLRKERTSLIWNLGHVGELELIHPNDMNMDSLSNQMISALATYYHLIIGIASHLNLSKIQSQSEMSSMMKLTKELSFADRKANDERQKFQSMQLKFTSLSDSHTLLLGLLNIDSLDILIRELPKLFLKGAPQFESATCFIQQEVVSSKLEDDVSYDDYVTFEVNRNDSTFSQLLPTLMTTSNENHPLTKIMCLSLKELMDIPSENVKRQDDFNKLRKFVIIGPNKLSFPLFGLLLRYPDSSNDSFSNQSHVHLIIQVVMVLFEKFQSLKFQQRISSLSLCITSFRYEVNQLKPYQQKYQELMKSQQFLENELQQNKHNLENLKLQMKQQLDAVSQQHSKDANRFQDQLLSLNKTLKASEDLKLQLGKFIRETMAFISSEIVIRPPLVKLQAIKDHLQSFGLSITLMYRKREVNGMRSSWRWSNKFMYGLLVDNNVITKLCNDAWQKQDSQKATIDNNSSFDVKYDVMCYPFDEARNQCNVRLEDIDEFDDGQTSLIDICYVFAWGHSNQLWDYLNDFILLVVKMCDYSFTEALSQSTNNSKYTYVISHYLILCFHYRINRD